MSRSLYFPVQIFRNKLPRRVLHSLLRFHIKISSTGCKMKILPAVLLCFASVAFGDDFKLINGREYKDATVSRVEPDGIVIRTNAGIAKVYFVELPKEDQDRFQYNPAVATAYSAQQAVNQPTAAVSGRGQPSEVISHGAQVDINQHLALGNVTVLEFYADWCGPCRMLTPSLEEMAQTDSEVALRKIDIVRWETPVAQQFGVHNLPQVNVYNRAGGLVGTVRGLDFDSVKRYVAQAKTGG
jgi:thiol-disulfide isomerase/thioredoxin